MFFVFVVFCFALVPSVMVLHTHKRMFLYKNASVFIKNRMKWVEVAPFCMKIGPERSVRTSGSFSDASRVLKSSFSIENGP